LPGGVFVVFGRMVTETVAVVRVVFIGSSFGTPRGCGSFTT
jgi:hypothetical protein